MSAKSNRSAGNVPQSCDGCGVDGAVARYCEYNDAMTYRRVAWLCEACHPKGT